MAKEKVVLVTGSSRGIGKATIIEFARKGYNVVINYFKNNIEAELLKEKIEKNYKVKVLIVKADVSNEDEVKSMIEQIIEEFDHIDVLVNNAGIVYDRNFEEITIDEFKRTLEVNAIGAFITSRQVSKYMKKGTIINISSTNGTKVVSPECLDYNISKIGLQSLTRDLAFQLKPHIRVNAIAIGWANTDMNKDLSQDYIASETSKIYLEKFAEPSEVARAICFLASDESSYINGETIVIDGGYAG